MYGLLLFLDNFFFAKILRIPDNGGKRNLDIFFFDFQETYRDATTKM